MVNQGTSIDMTRDTGSYSFVKEPDVQEFALSDYYGTHGNHPQIMNTYPEHSDVNDGNDQFGWIGWIIVGSEIDEETKGWWHQEAALHHLFDVDKAIFLSQKKINSSNNERLIDNLELFIRVAKDRNLPLSVVRSLPDDIGIQCVGSKEIWYSLRKSVYNTFMIYKNAIRVNEDSFEVYILNDSNLNRIKTFLKNNVDKQKLNKKIYIEQVEPKRQQEHRVIDFINFVDKPQDAWKQTYTTPGQDVNDLSLTDIWEGAKDIGKSVLENVGIIDKTTTPPTPPIVSPKPEPVIVQQPKIETPSEKNISSLKLYLQNPTPAAQAFLNGKKYTGIIDGKYNPQIKELVSIIETNLNNLLETRKFSGILLTTTPDDIESALQKAQKYKLSLANCSKDERFFKLGKILIQKQGI